jgi:O-methyltransferase
VTAEQLRARYLDLIGECLTGVLYEDAALEMKPGGGGLLPYEAKRREIGMDWPSRAHSMIGRKRMHQLRHAAEQVIQQGIPGDFIETGVWRGGACIMLRAVLEAYAVRDRRVWLADSFAGLPPPDPKRYPADAGQILHTYPPLAVSVAAVRANFARYGLLDEQVMFLEGWFRDTLARAPIDRLAILRLDGDLYESTIEALEALYDKVSVGGFVIVDDYGIYPGCRKAVADFRAARGIVDSIEDIDGSGVFWRRTDGREFRAAPAYSPLPHQVDTSGRSLPWKGDTQLDFGEVTVELCIPPELYERQSTPGHFILGKSRGMVEAMMAAVAAIPVRNIVDVGVYKGGSIVFLNEAFRPQRLVGVDFSVSDVPPLREYCNAPERATHIAIHLGVNQADRPALARICDHAFADEPIDLVVDDASHFYAETRETFRALFPRVRPGGVYIIEDWGWAHWPGDYWQKENGGDYFRSKVPLSNMLVELMLLCASSPGFLRRVSFNETVIYVERGPDPIPPDFEPSAHYYNRGVPIPKLDAPNARMVFVSPTFVVKQN